MTSWKRFFALFLLGLLLASGAQACVEHCECFHCDQHAAANCETVRGDLRIEDNGSEVNLGCLKHVDGNLIMADQSSIRTLNLWALETVGGDLIIDDNRNLKSFSAPSLREVEGKVLFLSNSGVERLELFSLRLVGGSMNFLGNDDLEILRLPSLQGVGQQYGCSGDLIVKSFDKSKDKSRDKGIIVSGDSLRRLDLVSLTGTEGDLFVSLDCLEVLELSSFRGIGGSMDVVGNKQLQFLHLITVLRVEGSLRVRDNKNLESFHMQSLATVDGDFILEGNDQLCDVELCDLRTVNGAFVLELSCKDDLEFQGLCGLTTIDDLDDTFIKAPGLCCGVLENAPLFQTSMLPRGTVCGDFACPQGQGCCGDGPGPSPAPTSRPSPAPTSRPTPAPTSRPTPAPTSGPAPTTGPEPVIQCPSSFGTPSEEGICGATVDLPLPTVENVPDAEIVQTAGFPSGTLYPVGCTEVEFEVYRATMFIGNCQLEVCVEDDQDPIINCPAPQTQWIDCEGGERGTEVFFSSPVGFDNCCEAEITQLTGKPSGTFLKVGIYRNVWMIQGDGNFAICSQRISVQCREDDDEEED